VLRGTVECTQLFFAGRLCQGFDDGHLQRRQVINDRLPDRFDINRIVLMPQPIADPTDVSPGQTWAKISASSPSRMAASLITGSLRSTAAMVFASA
jgi:hypothetical protein